MTRDQGWNHSLQKKKDLKAAQLEKLPLKYLSLSAIKIVKNLFVPFRSFVIHKKVNCILITLDSSLQQNMLNVPVFNLIPFSSSIMSSPKGKTINATTLTDIILSG